MHTVLGTFGFEYLIAPLSDSNLVVSKLADAHPIDIRESGRRSEVAGRGDVQIAGHSKPRLLRT
jgi:hypothetical protein